MSKQTDQHNPIIEMLETLKETPERDAARADKGREQFLAQAKQISEQTVSVSWFSRLKDVFGPARPALQLSTLTIALVIGVLLLGFSSSVVAAQQAQPDQLLYPYRLWLEGQRLALTSNPESRVELHLQYAEERLEELQAASYTPGDSDYDRTAANFNRQISAANELLLQSQLNGSLKDKLENLDQKYRELFEDDDDEPDDDRETPEEDEDLDDDQDVQDDDKIEPEGHDDSEKPGKYQKEFEDSDDDEHGENGAGSGADDDDNPDDSDDPDDSESSDDDEPDQPDETDEPDDKPDDPKDDD